MIQNDDQLRRTSEALCCIEASLAASTRRREEIHPARFALMAEPVLDELHHLRAEIDRYIGLSDAEHAVAVGRSAVGEPAGGAA
jgi:hypothetical protein